MVSYAGSATLAAGSVVPQVADYNAAGVVLAPPVGVSAQYLAQAVNTVLASAPITGTSLGATDLAVSATLQTMADAYSAILAGSAESTHAGSGLSLAQYSALGLTALSTAAEIRLMNAVLAQADITAVDTQADFGRCR